MSARLKGEPGELPPNEERNQGRQDQPLNEGRQPDPDPRNHHHGDPVGPSVESPDGKSFHNHAHAQGYPGEEGQIARAKRDNPPSRVQC